MFERAKEKTEDEGRDLRHTFVRGMNPHVLRLRLAIEAFIEKAPAFVGDSDLCTEIGIALADVEALGRDLRRRDY